MIGPSAFVAAWVGSSRATEGYSVVSDFISDLAALGAPTRPAMTLGFVAFGVGVPLYAVALRDALPGRAWATAALTGLATLGVAAFPLEGTDLQKTGHAVFAAAGYVTLALTPLLAAGPLAAGGRPRLAAASRAIGVASAACLAATTLGPAHGLLQRTGLTIVDAWIVGTAVAILRRSLLVTAGAPRGSRRPGRGPLLRSRRAAARRPGS